jgi:predicted adenine nucleotide alpha hydrolase (AANH) superfamily ATPase
MKKLLVHSCCAPCTSAVIERLRRLPDYDVTVFFYNPNVQPLSEYERRLSELERFLAEYGNKYKNYGVKLMVGEYDNAHFKCAVAGFEHISENGERCEKCYALRLEETAKTAAAYGFDCFTTTLTLSSKKNAARINEIAAEVAAKYCTKRLWADFKKDDGYNRSIELCNEYGLYRQSYCGCGL